jgi:hypothetical protein
MCDFWWDVFEKEGEEWCSRAKFGEFEIDCKVRP